jgi:hypothetical protein
MTNPSLARSTRRDLLGRGAALAAAAIVMGAAGRASVQAKDYASKREALDELDRLAAVCGMRLGVVRRSRPGADLLAARFLAALGRHRDTREDVRHRFSLPAGAEPGSWLGEVDADLPALRQSLDDLMTAYAESLPVFGDSTAVSRLAVDMVEVSKLRTVIDLWVAAEEA